MRLKVLIGRMSRWGNGRYDIWPQSHNSFGLESKLRVSTPNFFCQHVLPGPAEPGAWHVGISHQDMQSLQANLQPLCWVPPKAGQGVSL